MKKIFIVIFFLLAYGCVFAKDVTVKVVVQNTCVNKGKIYVGIFNSSEGLNNKTPFRMKTLESTGSTVAFEIVLPEGCYVVSGYQDKNSNNKLDSNIIGMPKEPVGVTNYKGKGMPGDFSNLKVVVDDKNRKMTVILFEF